MYNIYNTQIFSYTPGLPEGDAACWRSMQHTTSNFDVQTEGLKKAQAENSNIWAALIEHLHIGASQEQGVIVLALNFLLHLSCQDGLVYPVPMVSGTVAPACVDFA